MEKATHAHHHLLFAVSRYTLSRMFRVAALEKLLIEIVSHLTLLIQVPYIVHFYENLL